MVVSAGSFKGALQMQIETTPGTSLPMPRACAGLGGETRSTGELHGTLHCTLSPLLVSDRSMTDPGRGWWWFPLRIWNTRFLA